MMKKVLAICDSDSAYTRAFVDFLRSQRNTGFTYLGFSNAEELIKHLDPKDDLILLTSDRCIEKRIGNYHKVLLFLTETREETDDVSIYKYQKITDIITEISVKCKEFPLLTNTGNLLFGKSKLFSVYSPVKRSGKSMFAAVLSGILARERSVLYLNLEASCGFEWAFAKEGNLDISDMIYDIRQEKTDIEFRLARSIQNNGYFDYLPPAPTAEDIRTIKYEELLELFRLLSGLNRYSAVVIEFDELLDGYMSVLSECDKVFMPLIDDEISIAKLRRFMKLTELRGTDPQKEKLVPLVLPLCEEDMVGIEGMDRILWSDFGVYVKEVIQEVGL